VFFIRLANIDLPILRLKMPSLDSKVKTQVVRIRWFKNKIVFRSLIPHGVKKVISLACALSLDFHKKQHGTRTGIEIALVEKRVQIRLEIKIGVS
jgi:hypothetical protein